MPDSAIRKVAFCPHCSNRAHQKLVHTQYYESEGYSWEDKGKDGASPIPAAYFVAVCETCECVLVYDAFIDIPAEVDFTQASLVFPKTGFHHQAVPKQVEDCYKEALLVKNISASSFAVQVRRGLEALCDERSIPKGKLVERLKILGTRGDMPPVLAEMSDALRLIGNDGAHPEGISHAFVWTIDEFFKAIIEYVYVAPYRLKEFRKSMDDVKARKAGTAGNQQARN